MGILSLLTSANRWIRIIDKDEDIEYLDDYKVMSPYILEIARQKISQGGDQLLKVFEEGFKDAKIGQYIDSKLKSKPESIMTKE